MEHFISQDAKTSAKYLAGVISKVCAESDNLPIDFVFLIANIAYQTYLLANVRDNKKGSFPHCNSDISSELALKIHAVFKEIEPKLF